VAVPVGSEEEPDLEQIEIELLLEGIHRRYGFDFREYAPASLRRRLRRRMDGEAARRVRRSTRSQSSSPRRASPSARASMRPTSTRP